MSEDDKIKLIDLAIEPWGEPRRFDIRLRLMADLDDILPYINDRATMHIRYGFIGAHLYKAYKTIFGEHNDN